MSLLSARRSRLPGGANTANVRRSVPLAFGLLVITAAMGSALTLTSLFPVMPAINAHYSMVPHSEFWVRGLVTAVSLAMVIGSPMAGGLIVRLGEHRVLPSAILVYVCCGVAGYFIDRLWLLLVSRVLLGLAEVTVSTTVLGMIGQLPEQGQRDRWMGLFSSAGAMWSMFWIEAAGRVAEFGWRFGFLFFLSGLVTLVFAAAALKARDRSEPVQAEKQAAPPLCAGKAALPWLLVGFALGAGAVENTTPLFLPFHLAELGEASPQRIARAMATVTIGVSIAAFLYGRTRRHLTVGRIYILSFLAVGLALIGLGSATSYAQIVILALLLGLAGGSLAPNTFAFAAAYGSREHAVRNIAMARAAFFVGPIATQAVLEPFASNLGNGSALVALGVLSLLLFAGSLANRQMRSYRSGSWQE